MATLIDEEAPARVDLYWLPLGAGDTSGLVRRSGELFEGLAAHRGRRARQRLYHSALEVRLPPHRLVIEMTPAWGNGAGDRGVVAEGPVGLSWLGRSRFFRYEVRRWVDGTIPDAAFAVASPIRMSREEHLAARVLDLVPAFPALTWGRDEQDAGDMWNSNSLTAWLLASSGHDMARVHLPPRGRAPGWDAGLVVAARDSDETRAVRPCHLAARDGSLRGVG